MHNRDEKQTPNPRQRRRVKRVADVDYDRTADSPSSAGTSDEERVVDLEGDGVEQLTGREFYENERPPHHGE
ncbi:hypothetical protein [Corynebacterium riegelii]|uniref:hypothetical protein n=1 Tax=Corynebacterium riegelii TaxID=156976 RepID=UPI0023F32425|nr:hypothetical protein [Corynebacterium riegelii]MDK7180704.1 hypothetical protein [Corynebacterium riegelii]